jgi:hypothetical protein
MTVQIQIERLQNELQNSGLTSQYEERIWHLMTELDRGVQSWDRRLQIACYASREPADEGFVERRLDTISSLLTPVSENGFADDSTYNHHFCPMCTSAYWSPGEDVEEGPVTLPCGHIFWLPVYHKMVEYLLVCHYHHAVRR